MNPACLKTFGKSRTPKKRFPNTQTPPIPRFSLTIKVFLNPQKPFCFSCPNKKFFGEGNKKALKINGPQAQFLNLFNLPKSLNLLRKGPKTFPLLKTFPIFGGSQIKSEPPIFGKKSLWFNPKESPNLPPSPPIGLICE